MPIMLSTNRPALRVPATFWLQWVMLLCLISEAVTHTRLLLQAAVGLAVLSIGTQWHRLIPLARMFFALALGISLILTLTLPEAVPGLISPAMQGTGCCRAQGAAR
jgi:hypothetical protein